MKTGKITLSGEVVKFEGKEYFRIEIPKNWDDFDTVYLEIDDVDITFDRMPEPLKIGVLVEGHTASDPTRRLFLMRSVDNYGERWFDMSHRRGIEWFRILDPEVFLEPDV